jgi:hypothetical protein
MEASPADGYRKTGLLFSESQSCYFHRRMLLAWLQEVFQGTAPKRVILVREDRKKSPAGSKGGALPANRRREGHPRVGARIGKAQPEN